MLKTIENQTEEMSCKYSDIIQTLKNQSYCYYKVDNDIKLLIDQILHMQKDFFGQNQLEKNKHIVDYSVGYVPGSLFRKNKNVIESKETYIYRKNLVCTNEIYEQYCQKMAIIAKEIFSEIIKDLDLDVNKYLGIDNMNTLYMLYYNETKTEMLNQYTIVGLNEHTDCGFLTFLYSTDGLDIYQNNQWINIDAKPYHFIVNVGDMLEELSGRKFIAVKHRVIPKKEKYSIAYFYEPFYNGNKKPCEKSNKYAKL